MAKTYGTVTTFTAGSVLTAAQLNTAGTAINNLVVPPLCVLRRAATSMTVNDNSNTDLQFDTEDFDTDGMFTPTSATITIQTSGVYAISCMLNMGAPCDVRGDLIFSIGGAEVCRDTRYGNSSERLGVNTIAALSSTDTLKFTVYQDNTANTSRSVTARAQVVWVGRTS